MHQAEGRNLELIPRIVGTRDHPRVRTVQFELDTIMNRFFSNLDAIKSQFTLVEQLKSIDDFRYEDILS